MVYFRIIIFRSVLTLACFYFPQNNQIIEATHSKSKFFPEQIQILETIQEFGRKLSYAQWRKAPSENVVLSTFSIGILLNLIMLGTDGCTNMELRKSLNYSDTEEWLIHFTYEKYLRFLQKSKGGVDLQIHVKLFVHEDFKILNSYKRAAERSYFCDIEILDFKGSPDASTKRINSWVSQKTEGKIEKILSKSLSKETKLVAANVIYFNGTWKEAFDKRLTRKGTFYTGTENITISMMSTLRNIPYIYDKKNRAQIIALPYKNERYSMIILQPLNFRGSQNSLQEIEKNLDLYRLKSLINKMQYSELEIKIPRMKLKFELNLKEDLKALGISQIFDSEADFGRLTSRDGMLVSDIIYKGVLEVTEEGTVAAAVGFGLLRKKSLPAMFHLDIPSLIFIRDNEIGSLLFWTKVMKPEPID